MSCYTNRRDSAKDRRRYGIIETRRASPIYRLVIDGLAAEICRRNFYNLFAKVRPSLLPASSRYCPASGKAAVSGGDAGFALEN
jgi:hypothetical protein